jgi:hypothetical protein
MKRLTIVTFFIVGSIFGSSVKSGEKGKTYALIATGINKDVKDRQAKDKALLDLRSFLLKNASIKSDMIAMLANSRSLVMNETQLSTAENLKVRIDAFAAKATTKDRFLFYYVGQANIADDKLRLNLPGADVTHEQLARWLSRIKTSSMLIVLDCPGAGLAVEILAGPGRIIIAGCTADQPYSTRFSEYFVPALADTQSDTNNDGRVSLLEAFTAASKKLDDFYRQMGLLKTETPILEDNGDGKAGEQPWKYKISESDGLTASKFFFRAVIEE